jgi:hypothetical protein
MNKLDKERQGKVNTILSEIEGIQLVLDIQNWDVLLGYISNIICQLDTDIAIEVMEQLGEEGKREAMSIKVNYGY